MKLLTLTTIGNYTMKTLTLTDGTMMGLQHLLEDYEEKLSVDLEVIDEEIYSADYAEIERKAVEVRTIIELIKQL